MSERYTRLFSLAENFYSTGAPVIIAAGALLKDNQTGNVLAQLKIRNISSKIIKAATISMKPLDTMGISLGDAVHYQYLDLQADRDTDFGQKTAIHLPDSTTRSFTVAVLEVIFADNSIWHGENQPWEVLAEPTNIDSLDDRELTKQFRIEYGDDFQNLLFDQKDLWYCVCGAVNRRGELRCHKCDRDLINLQTISIDDIQKKKESRITQGRIKAETARAKIKIQAKKIAKIAAILVVIIAAASIIPGIVSKNKEYKNAISLMKSGKNSEAIVAFEEMGNYRDSTKKVEDCHTAILNEKYDAAISKMDAGQYEDAIVEFYSIETYKDSLEKAKECEMKQCQSIYDKAVDLESSGKIAEAAMLFGSLETFSDASSRSFKLWDSLINRKTIDIDSCTAVGIQSNGHVTITGRNADSIIKDLDDTWTDIVEVAIGDDFLLGLKSDGTTVESGWRRWDFDFRREPRWRDIVSVSAGSNHVAGLKKDGTVVVVGNSDATEQCLDTSSWTGIIAISASGDSTIGLKADGTVVATGKNKYGECNVSDWRDIVAIASSCYHTIGLKKDGTMVAVGSNDRYINDIFRWKDIVAIDVYDSLIDGCILGVRSDGSVRIAQNQYSHLDVSDWEDIVEVSLDSNAIGLKSEGTVVVEGSALSGTSLDYAYPFDWTNIKIPNAAKN